jgi:hypothetical protein
MKKGVLSSDLSVLDSFDLENEKNYSQKIPSPSITINEESKNSISTIDFGVVPKFSSLFDKNAHTKINKTSSKNSPIQQHVEGNCNFDMVSLKF